MPPADERPDLFVVEFHNGPSPTGYYRRVLGELSPAIPRVRSKKDLIARFAAANPESSWLSSNANSFEAVVGSIPVLRGARRLMVFEQMQVTTRYALDAYFRHILSPHDAVHLLDAHQLAHVLADSNRRNLFIGCSFDEHQQAMVLFRGTIEPLVIPVKWFSARTKSIRPDPRECAVTDFGQTLRLGTYEAAASAILYEFDPVFRRDRRKQVFESDASLGASIRRLRLQRGLSRADFGLISEKTLARIERNEVATPHRASLNAIAARLRVPVCELGSY